MQRPRSIKEAGESEELNISNRGILEMGAERQRVCGMGGDRSQGTLEATLSVLALSATESP